MWQSLRRLAPFCLLVAAAAVAPPGRHPAPGRLPPEEDPGPGGGPPAEYQGVYRREVRYLLDRVGGWRTPRDVSTDGGVPPAVPIACVRDAYVAAAVQHAWAAESYYRLRHPEAGPMAAAARDDLDQADELCPVTGRGGVEGCATLRLWGCPPPP